MTHVAQEMQRQKFSTPLLIGGATTSRAHTAVKIAPHYRESVVHVLDASRAVGVVNTLLNQDAKRKFDVTNRADHERLRDEHASRIREKKMLTLEQARANRPVIDWSCYVPPKPEFLGPQVYASDGGNGSSVIPSAVEAVTQRASTRPGFPSRRQPEKLPKNAGGSRDEDFAVTLRDFSTALRSAQDDKEGGPATGLVTLETLVTYIDWSPFFHTWELRGRYPAILDDPAIGGQARELFEDAQQLLTRIVQEDLLAARGVFAIWPANAVGDDVEIYADESRRETLGAFHFLRQQMQKPVGQANFCLADFVAPKSSALRDYLGGFAVTAGIGVDELAKKFQAEHDDYDAIMTKALADRLAEAFAEYLHKQARIAWGYGEKERLTNDDLIRECYRGIRPAAGYPASPDHTEKQMLFQQLNAEHNTGIRLTESFAMHPGASVSGLYFSHPDSKYFAVGKIERDQAVDYAKRKGETIQAIEKWLAPNLNY